MPARPLLVSRWWVQGAGITYLVGFAILGVLAYLTYAEQPPIPARVVDPSGEVLYTREDVLDGMNVFQRYGLMEYGTVYGHGAYLARLHRRVAPRRGPGAPRAVRGGAGAGALSRAAHPRGAAPERLRPGDGHARVRRRARRRLSPARRGHA